MAVFDDEVPEPEVMTLRPKWRRKMGGFSVLCGINLIWAIICGFFVGSQTCTLDNLNIVDPVFNGCKNATICMVVNFVSPKKTCETLMI